MTLLRNTTRILISVLLLASGAWAARDLTLLRVRGTRLACPVAAPDGGLRSVLEALDKGKFDKARKKLASMRLDSVARPEIPLLSALADFADRSDPSGQALLPLLDAELPAHVQIRAEVHALRGEPCRAGALYAELPAPWLESLRLLPRGAALDEACLDAFAAQVDARWREGDFDGMGRLWEELPPSLRMDGRAARALFPATVLAGDAVRARTLLDRLPARERDRCGVMVSALDLAPSLRLSYLKQGGEALLKDPLGEALYARTLDEWLVGNMPPDFRRAWDSPALTQRDLALLLCLHFPGLKGGASPGVELPPDVLEDPQAECLAPLVAQGFFPGYDAGALVPAQPAVLALARALETAGLMAPCAPGVESWVRCGLLPPGQGGGPFSGRQWSVLAHRARGDLP